MKRRSPILVIVLALLVVGASVSAAVALRSEPVPNLPRVSVGGLIRSMLQAASRNPSVSGDLSVRVDLGLPDIGDLGQFSGNPLAALVGDHHLRMWRSSAGIRITDVLPLSERSLFVGPSGVWGWDFDTFTAYHVPVPHNLVRSFLPVGVSLPNLEEVAAPLWRSLWGASGVSVEGATTVAGRPSYRLVIRPPTARTTVDRIEMDVDAAQRIPLGVLVYARGDSAPAISVQFTGVSFDPIDTSVFDFTPPPGAKVREISPLAVMSSPALLIAPLSRVRTFGQGWSTVVAFPAQSLPPALRSLLPLSGPLVSARLAGGRSGRWILIGMVPQSELARVAGKLQ